MRKNPTAAEAKLWEVLRGRQLGGLYCRRQFPFKSFILDFYCHQARLGIEIDGSIHENKQSKEYDGERSAILQEYGIRIIRFTNAEIFNDLRGVVRKIFQALSAPPLPQRSEGEGPGGGGMSQKSTN